MEEYHNYTNNDLNHSEKAQNEHGDLRKALLDYQETALLDNQETPKAKVIIDPLIKKQPTLDNGTPLSGTFVRLFANELGDKEFLGDNTFNTENTRIAVKELINPKIAELDQALKQLNHKLRKGEKIGWNNTGSVIEVVNEDINQVKQQLKAAKMMKYYADYTLSRIEVIWEDTNKATTFLISETDAEGKPKIGEDGKHIKIEINAETMSEEQKQSPYLIKGKTTIDLDERKLLLQELEAEVLTKSARNNHIGAGFLIALGVVLVAAMVIGVLVATNVIGVAAITGGLIAGLSTLTIKATLGVAGAAGLGVLGSTFGSASLFNQAKTKKAFATMLTDEVNAIEAPRH